MPYDELGKLIDKEALYDFKHTALNPDHPWLAALYIVFSVYSFYLQQVLGLRWRKWLTAQYLDRWLTGRTYYRLQMFGTETDNPDQRISEDINLFVTKTIELTVGFIKAICVLTAFIIILYQISGTLEFTLMGVSWHIPGYLVWIAILYAVIGTCWRPGNLWWQAIR